jgi:single-strand DNA-binding protein
MSRDINVVVLSGNLTADAEIKSTNSGISVVNFSLANNQDYKKDNNLVKKVNFVNVFVWGKFGEAVHQYLKKGTPVVVEGQLDHQRWTDENNNNRSTLKVKMTGLRMFGSKNSDGNARPQEQGPVFNEAEFEDDIPF